MADAAAEIAPSSRGPVLASVTDRIIDRFNPNRLLIGPGNIGKRTANDPAGVWKLIDGGQTPQKQISRRGAAQPAGAPARRGRPA
jgi:hypothetical protein